jgi:hypothetical protein
MALEGEVTKACRYTSIYHLTIFIEIKSQGFAICPDCGMTINCGTGGIQNLNKRHRVGKSCREAKIKRDRHVKTGDTQGGVGINKRHLGSIFFSVASGRPTYYVIRHQSIYGNNDIIAMDVFLHDLAGTTNRPRKPNSLASVQIVCI